MNISAASKAAGLPVKTVRYYADIGLVDAPSRSDAGYRTYDDVAVAKLVFVGLISAVRCALVEGPLRPATRPLQHHSSQTFTKCSRMTSSAYPEP